MTNGLVRSLGLLQATALNMTNMVGIGVFIALPGILAALGGPQAMLGWVLGAVLALCDGLVWAELAAALPGAGGTYLYFREGFKNTRLGLLLPFLFIWQFIFSGPLEIASGFIGFSDYLGYFWASMGSWHARAVAVLLGALVVAMLYRGVTAIGRLTVVLWIGMLITVGWIIASGLIHFDTAQVFAPRGKPVAFSGEFLSGLGQATLKAMYCFLGYYDICFIAGEVRNPARVIPRAILYSVLAIAAIYLLLTVCFLSVLPWEQAVGSKFIAAEFMARLYPYWGGAVVTLLILWTAFASIFALVLGYSRIPYAAAVDGNFFRPFARLHPKGNFPYVSLLAIAALSVGASMLNLGVVLEALITARILIQFVGQIAAVEYIRRRRPDLSRPFQIWLYPLPSLIALAGWIYIYATSQREFILWGLLVPATGVVAYRLWGGRSARAGPPARQPA